MKVRKSVTRRSLAKTYERRLKTYYTELLDRKMRGLPIEPSAAELEAFFTDLLTTSHSRTASQRSQNGVLLDLKEAA